VHVDRLRRYEGKPPEQWKNHTEITIALSVACENLEKQKPSANADRTTKSKIKERPADSLLQVSSVVTPQSVINSSSTISNSPAEMPIQPQTADQAARPKQRGSRSTSVKCSETAIAVRQRSNQFLVEFQQVLTMANEI